MYTMLSFNKGKFTSSFPIWMCFLSSSCLISLTRTSSTTENRHDEIRQSCFVPDHRRKAFGLSPLRMMSGLPWWRSGWESACRCRGHGFEPWSGRIPHAAEQLGPCTTTTEPERLEPVLRQQERPPIMKGPRTAMKSGPRSPQLEKARVQQRRPNTANQSINQSIEML